MLIVSCAFSNYLEYVMGGASRLGWPYIEVVWKKTPEKGEKWVKNGGVVGFNFNSIEKAPLFGSPFTFVFVEFFEHIIVRIETHLVFQSSINGLVTGIIQTRVDFPCCLFQLIFRRLICKWMGEQCDNKTQYGDGNNHFDKGKTTCVPIHIPSIPESWKKLDGSPAERSLAYFEEIPHFG